MNASLALLTNPALPPQAAYLRVASLSIGLYDYICTLPAEYRFYRSQKSFRNISQACILFVLIRYISISVLIISNIGFFGNDFSNAACQHYFIISPVFKVLQVMVCQIILAFRTYSISKRASWVRWAMISLLLVTVPLEFFSNLYRRTAVRDKGTENCSSGNASKERIAWLFYVIVMIYDLSVVGISSAYLWYYSATGTRMSQFMRTLLYEGMGYLAVLTDSGINVFNLVLYRSNVEDLQTSGSSLGFVAVWVMSQRILIHQRNAAEKYAADQETSETSYVIHTQSLDTSREINKALQSQFENHKTRKSTLNFSNLPSSSHNDSVNDEESQVQVEVRIEKRVQVHYDTENLEREDYRRTRSIHESRYAVAR